MGDQGVYGMPLVGSAGHYLGQCTPCDFVHGGSCRTGIACKYCHLFGPEENKRRKKEKRKFARAMVNWVMNCGGCMLPRMAVPRGAPSGRAAQWRPAPAWSVGAVDCGGACYVVGLLLELGHQVPSFLALPQCSARTHASRHSVVHCLVVLQFSHTSWRR